MEESPEGDPAGDILHLMSDSAPYFYVHRLEPETVTVPAPAPICPAAPQIATVAAYSHGAVITTTVSVRTAPSYAYNPNNVYLHLPDGRSVHARISPDGTFILEGDTEGLLSNPYTITLPAGGYVTTTVPAVIVWEQPKTQPWLQVSYSARLLLLYVFFKCAGLPVSPCGPAARNEPLESHDHSAWSLFSSPARSELVSLHPAA